MYIDINSHVNIHTTLDIAPKNINCEGFSSTHFYLLIFLPYFTLFLSHIFNTFSYLRSYVTQLCINFNIIPFLFVIILL